ncbi:MAG: hypothetical protein JWM25_1968 [Thermoleophilia bacterium]|nr:hypothetical protein [Thermoleophilia bacterium]MCZ4497383.1 hypothetical protein [Thermoleophilia bacterium]
MAQLQVTPDLLTPGRWTVRSDHPGALAGVSDAIVQTLNLQNEALAAWALHYDEQDMHSEDAYARERQELGIHAQSLVVALPTPARAHTVYIDRLHLLAQAAPPAAGSRLAGLYVGSAGDLVLAVHHPSVTMQVGGTIAQLPHDRTLRDGQRLVGDSRFVLVYDREDPTAVQVRAPQPMAMPVQDALGRLAGLVAGW